MNTIANTKRTVRQGWNKHVQCELDHPCCEIEEPVAINMRLAIHTLRNDYLKASKTWWELERRRIEIEIECRDDLDFPGCPEQATCLDQSQRDFSDEFCGCKPQDLPACPMYSCFDGSDRDEDTCFCTEWQTDSEV